MANLNITEFAALGEAGDFKFPVAKEPAVTTQSVTFTSATQSAAFNAQTRFVRLLPDANCYVLFGANPTAVATSEKLASGQEAWRAVNPEDKVSVYDGSS